MLAKASEISLIWQHFALKNPTKKKTSLFGHGAKMASLSGQQGGQKHKNLIKNTKLKTQNSEPSRTSPCILKRLIVCLFSL